VKPSAFPKDAKAPTQVTAKARLEKMQAKQESNATSMARHQSFEDIADEAMKANKWPKYWTSNGMQKSQLLREIGGFSQKEYLAGFYTSMFHRQEQEKHAPKTVQGPDEEFVK